MSGIALLVLMGLGFWLRADGLAAWYFTGDDAWHVLHALDAKLPSLEGFRALISNDTHPPLYYLSTYYWLQLGGGASPFVLRLPTLLAGVTAIPLFYLIGRQVAGAWAGFALAILLTFGAEPVLQSQTIRHYALLLVLEGGLLAVCLQREINARHVLLAGILSVFVVACHYGSALVVICLGIVLLGRWLRQERASWKRKVGIWVLAFLPCAAAWTALASYHLTHYERMAYIEDYYLDSGLELLRFIQGLHTNLYIRDPRFSWVLSLVTAFGVLTIVRRREWHLLALYLGPLVVVLAASAVRAYPVSDNRWALFLVPTTVLPLAAALGEIARWPRKLAITSAGALAGWLVLSLSLPSVTPLDPESLRLAKRRHWVYHTEEFRSVLRVVEEDPAPMLFGLATRLSFLMEQKMKPSWGVVPHPQRLWRPYGGRIETATWRMDDDRAAIRKAAFQQQDGAFWVLMNVADPEASRDRWASDACVAITRLEMFSHTLVLRVDAGATMARMMGPGCEADPPAPFAEQ